MLPLEAIVPVMQVSGDVEQPVLMLGPASDVLTCQQLHLWSAVFPTAVTPMPGVSVIIDKNMHLFHYLNVNLVTMCFYVF